eukprot:gene3431-3924_t
MQSTIHSLKRSLRKNLRLRLKHLTDETKAIESKRITEKLLNSTYYKQSTRISIYLSMPSEVRTMGILQDMLTSGKKCFIPLYTEDDMKMVLLHDMDDYNSLPVTSWNIKQPNENEQRETAIDGGGLDLILLPGLGFTKSGLRIGRGRGYYDSYLKKHLEVLKKKPYTIGLAFSKQICEDIPCTDQDVKLDLVLTPD